MKRVFVNVFLLTLVIFLTMSCATQQAVQKPPESAASMALNAKLQSGEYQQRVNSFLVILDASGSMQNSFRGRTKLTHAKDFLQRLEQTIPDVPLSAGLRTLGQHFANDTRLAYGMKSYARGDLGKATRILNAGGLTPLGGAIKATTEDLKAASGNMAVIIVSDGMDRDKTSVDAAKAMKARYGNRVCIYTVLVGDDAEGRVRMVQIADAGECGIATTALTLASSDEMVDFVTQVFLSKALVKAPPAPPVRAPVIGDADGDGVPDHLDQCPGTPLGARVDERGCWVYEDTVLFDFDSAKIKSGAFPALDEVASVLKKNPQVRIEIEGHTCSIGPDAYNQKLSENRAKAVMQYLVNQGVSADRMTMKGYGKTKPAYPNDTKENRAKNRRVEFTPIF